MRSHDASSILGLVCSRRCTSAGQQAIASLYDAGRRRYRVKNSTASAQQRRRRGRGADPIGPRPCPRPRSRRDPILFREAAERQVYVPLRKYPSHFSRARGHGGPPWAFCSPFRSCLHPEHPRTDVEPRPLLDSLLSSGRCVGHKIRGRVSLLSVLHVSSGQLAAQHVHRRRVAAPTRSSAARASE